MYVVLMSSFLLLLKNQGLSFAEGHSSGLCIVVLKNSQPESEQLMGRAGAWSPFLFVLSVCLCLFYVCVEIGFVD